MEGTTSVTKQTKVKNSANIILLIWCIANLVLYILSIGLGRLEPYLIGECHNYYMAPSDAPLYPAAIASIIASAIVVLLSALSSFAIPFAIKNNTTFRIIAFVVIGISFIVTVVVTGINAFTMFEWLNQSL